MAKTKLTMNGYLSFVLRAQTAQDEGTLAELIMPNGKKARECTPEYIDELEKQLVEFENLARQPKEQKPSKRR